MVQEQCFLEKKKNQFAKVLFSHSTSRALWDLKSSPKNKLEAFSGPAERPQITYLHQLLFLSSTQSISCPSQVLVSSRVQENLPSQKNEIPIYCFCH